MLTFFLVLCLVLTSGETSHSRISEQLREETMPFGTSQEQPPVRTSALDVEVEVTGAQIASRQEIPVTQGTSKSKGNTQEPVIKSVIQPADHSELNDKYFYDDYSLKNNDFIENELSIHSKLFEFKEEEFGKI